MRLTAIGLMAALALACGGIAAGLRYNGTSSYPVGFYLSSGKRAQRGDLVFVSLPSSLVLDMARERGYLNVAYCSVNHLLKRLAGVPGDRVTIDAAGVEVNGIHLANSSPRAEVRILVKNTQTDDSAKIASAWVEIEWKWLECFFFDRQQDENALC
jgi:conjugative transfer signal peptidase TraF